MLVTAVMVMRVLVNIKNRLSRRLALLGKGCGRNAGEDAAKESAP